MSQKEAKIIRVSTVAPIIAAALITLLYFGRSDAFYGFSHYIAALIFLVVLPLFSYPVSMIFHKIREKGRNGQRNLSIIFSVVGYLCGILFCIFFGHTKIELVLYLTYLLSGIIIALLSFVFKIKGSGHACGVSGPVAMLTVYLGAPYAVGFILLALVFRSSLILKRHTVSQLIIGSIVPVICLGISIITVSLL